MSPATANVLKVENAELVELTYRGRRLRAPVWIQPGHGDACVTLHLGYGRAKVGRVGDRIGFDPYGLRTSAALWNDFGLEVKGTGAPYQLVSTQSHHALDTRRNIIHGGTIEEYRKDPESVHQAPRPRPRA